MIEFDDLKVFSMETQPLDNDTNPNEKYQRISFLGRFR